MRNDGAEDTGDVTSGKSDHQLLGFAAVGSGLGNNVGVNGLDSLFEAGEFHHCVWNLSHPKWLEAFDEGSVAFFSLHLWETGSESRGVISSLDSNLEK